MTKLSIIILTKNSEKDLAPALISSQFADEIVVVDTGSTDKTVSLAKKYNCVIVHSTGKNFSDWRNDGAKTAKGEWLMYLDSDERITPELADEIIFTINNPKFPAYTIPRFEVFLGKHLANWGDPRVLRLIKKSSLKGWQGKLHEQPKIMGEIGKVRREMIHLSHKNIDEKINKTIIWSKEEGEMLYKSGHPPIVWWRFLRIMLTEFWNRAVKQGLWRDGTEGWIEIIYQTFSRFQTYVRLWELQQKPSLKEKYQKIDQDLVNSWQRKSS